MMKVDMRGADVPEVGGSFLMDRAGSQTATGEELYADVGSTEKPRIIKVRVVGQGDGTLQLERIPETE